MIRLTIDKVGRTFQDRRVLRGISAEIQSGDVVGVIGPNGSGKTTLVRIIAGLLRPDTGSVTLRIDDATIEQRRFKVGLVAPWLHIYDEFTPTELLDLSCKLRGEAVRSHDVLSTVGLHDRGHDIVRTFSSGMRQRVMIALAIHHSPPLLILDEPSVTLDSAGRELVRSVVAEHSKRGGVVILATNDDVERAYCTTFLSVE